MNITYKHLKNVEYPAYKIDADNIELCDGLLFLDGQIVDDRNMPGKTLGLRRLQSPMKGLYELKKAVIDPVSMIRNPAGSYIDSLGRIFTYTKTRAVPLKYSIIRKVDKKETYSLVWVKGINFPYTVKRPPVPGNTWAGILYVDGHPWLLYSYATEKQKDTWRKI